MDFPWSSGVIKYSTSLKNLISRIMDDSRNAQVCDSLNLLQDFRSMRIPVSSQESQIHKSLNMQFIISNDSWKGAA